MTNALRDGHLQYRLYSGKGTPHRLLLLPRFLEQTSSPRQAFKNPGYV